MAYLQEQASGSDLEVKKFENIVTQWVEMYVRKNTNIELQGFDLAYAAVSYSILSDHRVKHCSASFRCIWNHLMMSTNSSL